MFQEEKYRSGLPQSLQDYLSTPKVMVAHRDTGGGDDTVTSDTHLDYEGGV